MRRRLQLFLKNEQGEAVFTFPAALLISMLFLVIAVNVIQYGMVSMNLRSIVSESLQQVKFENGSDASIRQKFYGLVETYGMNPDNITYQATAKQVQRGDQVMVTAGTTYHIWSLDLLGFDMDVPIKVTAYGFAYKFIREGG